MTTWPVTQTRDTFGGVSVAIPGPMLNGDTSAIFEYGPSLATKSIQVTGTPGAGMSLQVLESNDGVNFIQTTASITAAGIKNYVLSARWGKILIASGDGTTSLSVILFITPQRGS